MDLQPQPPSSLLPSALQWLTAPLLVLITALITTFVNRKSRTAETRLTGANERLADATTRHTEAESQQLAWERIDVLHKIIEAKDAELLRLRALDEEVKILTGWNKRMKATLTSRGLPVPDKWASGDEWKREG